MPSFIDTRQKSTAHLWAAWLFVGAVFATSTAQALGTAAGRAILSATQLSFDIAGVAQMPISSNSAQVFVDELLDTVLVNDNGGPVAVSPGQLGAILQYTLTNTGNGSESFRLIADESVSGDIFDPVLVAIHLESNAIAGLQIGAGGDTAYLAGSNDPLLGADAMQIVYVQSNIPIGEASNADGIIELRAVANTIFVSAGTDDPNDAAFPPIGSFYAGQGDLDESGAGNVVAIVGTSHDAANRLFLTQAGYLVSVAVVALTKSAVTILDPFGGSTLVPGTVITYQIDVAVSGASDAERLVISDPIPADLQYLPGSLSVSMLPAGEESDDDFAPSGSDNTGFDGANQTIVVNLKSVPGGSPVISMTFQTTIR